MTEAWSVRVRRVMKALGWPIELMAQELGLVKNDGVKRLLRGGRPSIDVLKRLQRIEREYAGAIEETKRTGRGPQKKAFVWPPRWVEHHQRRWIGGPDRKPPARPADLAALGGGSTDAARLLTGWLDPRNNPGRVLRIVDWTVEGRRKYAADREDAARRRDAAKRSKPATVDPVDPRRTGLEVENS